MMGGDAWNKRSQSKYLTNDGTYNTLAQKKNRKQQRVESDSSSSDSDSD